MNSTAIEVTLQLLQSVRIDLLRLNRIDSTPIYYSVIILINISNMEEINSINREGDGDDTHRDDPPRRAACDMLQRQEGARVYRRIIFSVCTVPTLPEPIKRSTNVSELN